jgi:hypothetical protein
MIEINTDSNNVYKYDEENNLIYKNDVLLPSSQAEAIFSSSNPPEFAGIHLIGSNQIISLSGQVHLVENVDNL